MPYAANAPYQTSERNCIKILSDRFYNCVLLMRGCRRRLARTAGIAQFNCIEMLKNFAKKLQDDDNSYRVRVGDYRVIYEVVDNVLIVTVIKVGHRSEIYKDES